jgi:hypothetical protein
MHEKTTKCTREETGKYNDWIHLAEDKGPAEGSCEHGNGLSGSIKY